MTKNLYYYRWIAIFTLIITHVSGYLFSQITVNTISDLRALSPGAEETVNVLGYYNPGDWGDPRVFDWQPQIVKKDNGGTIIVPNNIKEGSWVMKVTENYYSVKWFGARGRDNPDDNDHIFILNTIKEAVSGPKRVKIPVGIYQLRTSINLTHEHNGLEIFGENIVESTSEDSRGFRTVVSTESAVLKRADTGPYESEMLFVTSSGSENIDDIRIKNLAFDGNRYTAKDGNHTILLNHRNKVGPNGINFGDIYVMRGGYVDQQSDWRSGRGSGILIYGNNVTMKRVLVYDAYFHGIGTAAGATNILLEDVEVYDLQYQWSIDVGRHSQNVVIKNFKLHNGRRGMKVANAKSATFINGIIERNEIQGFRVNTYGDYYQPVDLYMENIHFEENGSYGLGITEDIKKAILKNITAKSNGSFDFYLTQPNITAYNLRSEGYSGDADYAVWIAGQGQVINNLFVNNSTKPGLRIEKGRVLINNGEIMNNKDYGIILAGDGVLDINHVKFGDSRRDPQQMKGEIFGGNETTVFHSGLDFSESVLASSGRIQVGNSVETTNVTLHIDYNRKIFFSEDSIRLEVFASSPNTDVKNVLFYANGELIGEIIGEPFQLTWVNMDGGEYSLKAIVTFTDGSHEESKAKTITVYSRQASHIIPLNPGWNAVSSHVQPYNLEIKEIFSGIEDNLSLMSTNSGKVYWPSLAINEINEWNYWEGYQLYMEEEDTLVINGLQVLPDESPIYLSEGWNLVAYFIDHPLPIESVFEDIKSSIQIVTNNDGAIYWPDIGINSIGELKPGQGYKIFTTSEIVFFLSNISIKSSFKFNYRTR
jgi:hypothetical protein